MCFRELIRYILIEISYSYNWQSREQIDLFSKPLKNYDHSNDNKLINYHKSAQYNDQKLIKYGKYQINIDNKNVNQKLTILPTL